MRSPKTLNHKPNLKPMLSSVLSIVVAFRGIHSFTSNSKKRHNHYGSEFVTIDKSI